MIYEVSRQWYRISILLTTFFGSCEGMFVSKEVPTKYSILVILFDDERNILSPHFRNQIRASRY